MTELNNRTLLVRALVGSHNYNLNGPTSDMDWKHFVLPSFDDLYTGKMFSSASQSATVDQSTHDIRKFPELLWKGNINFVEVLFSVNKDVHSRLSWVFNEANTFGMMNPKATVSATMGMHFQKMANLLKGTETTRELVKKFGYDTKQACHALRCLFFVSRLAETRDFKKALWFDNTDPQRGILLDVKNGIYSHSEFLEMVVDFQPSPRVEELKNMPGNREILEDLNSTVKNIIRSGFLGGL